MNQNIDSLERRCPRLGSPVTFRYCRETGKGDLPCWKVIDCWWEYFDVVSVLQENFSEEEFAQIINARPKPKLTSLIELVEAAKKRCDL